MKLCEEKHRMGLYAYCEQQSIRQVGSGLSLFTNSIVAYFTCTIKKDWILVSSFASLWAEAVKDLGLILCQCVG